MRHTTSDTLSRPSQSRFYYGWVIVLLAAAAMVGTLPGRTNGLGLITEPLIKDLGLGRSDYARINFWATLIGALFCVGVGRMQDRLGTRVVLTAIAAALGATVVAMSAVTTPGALFPLVTLTRGLGQSALSVVSLAMVGLWFRRRINTAMAWFSVVMSIGFMVAFQVMGEAVKTSGWRPVWAGAGWVLILGLAPAALLLGRRAPRPDELDPEETSVTAKSRESYTLVEAVSTPAFWVIGLATAAYGLIFSGIGLFNESILAELGFSRSVFVNMQATIAMTMLAGNFLGGWLAGKWSMSRLMAVAMALLTVALMALPAVRSASPIFVIATLFGLAGGFVTVLFFSYWRTVYGTQSLGQIQGAAQTLTVVASAVGPLLLASTFDATGSYAGWFYALGGVAAVLGAACWVVRPPVRSAHLA